MKCQNCGQEIGDAHQCSYCGFGAQEANVREMSQSEKYGYEGTTIDETGQEGREDNTFYRQRPGGARIFVRGIELGHSNTWVDKLFRNYWLSRIVIALIVAALVTVLVFVALPIVLMVAAVGIVVWMMLRFLRS